MPWGVKRIQFNGGDMIRKHKIRSLPPLYNLAELN
uniref:Uncharacterized protein n=1 Tax=Anguilla anguilla TaxID=7936 RepID=A0A0E9SAW1_ANGAN